MFLLGWHSNSIAHNTLSASSPHHSTRVQPTGPGYIVFCDFIFPSWLFIFFCSRAKQLGAIITIIIIIISISLSLSLSPFSVYILYGVTAGLSVSIDNRLVICWPATTTLPTKNLARPLVCVRVCIVEKRVSTVCVFVMIGQNNRWSDSHFRTLGSSLSSALSPVHR